MSEHTSELEERGLPCDECDSSDAVALYDDGHIHCFSCGNSSKGDVKKKSEKRQKMAARGLIKFETRPISKRGLSQEICRAFEYGVATAFVDGVSQGVQVANYHTRDGEVVAQKLRTASKEFTWYGHPGKAGLFGQHKAGSGGERIIITEGEIDALTVAQVLDGKTPCVSLPNGANAARKDVEKAFEWLDTFKFIDLCFDNDAPGRDAVHDVAKLFAPGKVRVIQLPAKDANEMLVADRAGELVKALWSPAPYRPNGVIDADKHSVKDLMRKIPEGHKTGFPILDEKLKGFRTNELTILGAGTGVGKTTLCRGLAYDQLVTSKKSVGLLFLEEGTIKTEQGFIALDNKVALPMLRENPDVITKEAFKASYDKIIKSGCMAIFDPDSDLYSVDVILSKVRYMAIAMKSQFIYIDHMTMIVNGSGDSEMSDTNKLISELARFAKSDEHNAHIILVCQLKKPQGKSYEEGGRIDLDSFKGSAAIKQYAFNAIGIERNQQGEGMDGNTAVIRLLKNREWGDLGECDTVLFDPETGRYNPVAKQESGFSKQSQKQAEAEYQATTAVEEF